MKKNILIISYFHENKDSIGSHRLRAFENYLKSIGFNVFVLCCEYGNETITFNKNNVKVKGYSRINSSLFFISILRMWRIIRMTLFGKYIIFGEYWVKNVIKYNESIFNHAKPDMILCSYPPIEAFMAGSTLSKIWNVPLVADYRDGLLYEPLEIDINSNSKKNKFYTTIEGKLLKRASLIITASEPLSHDLNRRYVGKRISTIMNGFDLEADIANDFDYKIHNKINIVHAGRISASQVGISISGLVGALKLLIENNLDDKIAIHFIGELTKKELSILAPFEQNGLVNIHGQKERSIARMYQKNADILLVINKPDDISAISGKLIEYIGFKKPILGLSKGTEAEKIITTTGLGICVSPLDSNEIYEELCGIIKNGGITIGEINADIIYKYSRDYQNSLLKINLGF